MQALFDVKAAAEKQAMADYAAAQRACDQAEEAVGRCRRRIVSEQGNLERDAQKGIAAQEYQNRSAYVRLLEEQARKLEDDLRCAREDALKKQLALQALYREKKVLERVRESQRRAFLKEETAREAREMDDLLTPRMARRMQERDDPA
jgi:flagellar FliJ protein